MLVPTLVAFLGPLEETLSRAQLGGREGVDLSRYLLVCTATIVFVGLLGWAVRKYFGHGLRRRAKRRSMQVMDMLPLGGKQRLAVVRCYDRTFLLGLGDKEVRLVSELDAVIEPPPPARGSVESSSFAELVRRAIGRGAVPPLEAAEEAEPQRELEPAARRGLGPGGLLG